MPNILATVCQYLRKNLGKIEPRIGGLTTNDKDTLSSRG